MGALSTAQSGLYSNRHKRGLDPPIANLKHNTECYIDPLTIQATRAGLRTAHYRGINTIWEEQHVDPLADYFTSVIAL